MISDVSWKDDSGRKYKWRGNAPGRALEVRHAVLSVHYSVPNFATPSSYSLRMTGTRSPSRASSSLARTTRQAKSRRRPFSSPVVRCRSAMTWLSRSSSLKSRGARMRPRRRMSAMCCQRPPCQRSQGSITMFATGACDCACLGCQAWNRRRWKAVRYRRWP